MVRSAKASRKKRTPRPTAAPVIDSAPPAVVEHPDGDGWQAPDGDQKFVPSESHEVALAERDAVGDEALAPSEALQEALHEIGTNEWIDAETGGPAEESSTPHLRGDRRPSD